MTEILTFEFSLAFSFIVVLFFAIFVFLRYKTPVAGPYSLTMFAVAGWILFLGLDVQAQTLQAKVLFNQLRFPFVAFVPVSWYWCILRYTQEKSEKMANPSWFLYLIPAITAILSLSMPFHNFLRHDFSLGFIGDKAFLSFTNGLWYWIHIAFQYTITMATLVKLFRELKEHANSFYIKRTFLLIVFTIFPLLLDVAFNFGFTPYPGYSIGPQSFAIIGPGHWYLLFQFNVFNLVPIARKSVMANLLDGIIVFDQNNMLIDFNASAVKFLRLPLTNNIGRSIEDVFVKFPKLVQLSSASEFIEINDSEQPQTIEVSYQPLSIESDSSPVGRIFTFRDVTSRMEVEKKLRDNERRYKHLLENSPFPAFIVDQTTDLITYANPLGLEWANLPKERVFGKKAVDFYANHEVRLQALEILKKEGKLQSFEVTLKRGENESRKVLMNARNIVFNEKNSTFVSFVDITEMRKIEKKLIEAELKNRELIVTEEEKQRIGRDLHDNVGQLLTGVSMTFQQVCQQLKNHEQPTEERMQSISSNLRQAIREARYLSHGLCPIDLDGEGLWNEVAELARNIRKQYGIKFILEPEEAVLISRQDMGLQLFRIIQEAVQNILKHSHAKKIKIAMQFEKFTGMLSIIDDGIGANSDRLQGGFGKGIAIMKFRASLLGGELKIISQKGSGMTVCCSFPLEERKNS